MSFFKGKTALSCILGYYMNHTKEKTEGFRPSVFPSKLSDDSMTCPGISYKSLFLIRFNF